MPPCGDPGVVYADARCADDPSRARKSVWPLNPEVRTPHKILLIEGSGDLEVFCHARRSAEARRHALEHVHTADEHRRGITRRFRNHIEEPMHAVRKVDVRVPGSAEHHGIPGRLASVRVARAVSRSAVRLGFDNLCAHRVPVFHSADEHHAEEIMRDFENVPIVKPARESWEVVVSMVHLSL